MGLCFTTVPLINWEMQVLKKYKYMKFMNLTGKWQKPNLGPGGGGVIPGNSWWGCAARFFKSWPYFRPKNVIFHTRFQTRPAAGYPTYHVNVIKLKWEIVWTGGLPHLPGVPRLHVNRPLGVEESRLDSTYSLRYLSLSDSIRQCVQYSFSLNFIFSVFGDWIWKLRFWWRSSPSR